VPTEVGLAARSVFDGHAIFLAASHQGFGVKLFGMVDLDQAR